jgi:hypothetical protein
VLKDLHPTIRTAVVCAILGGCAQQPQGGRSQPITLATHTFFPIASGPHAVDCNTCHGSYTTFTKFDCVSCHGHGPAATDQLHTSVADYAYRSDACLSCHPDGSRRTFDHAGITSGCVTCHAQGATFAALPVAGFAHQDVGSTDCSVCHTPTAWTGATGAPVGLSVDPTRALVVDALTPIYSGVSISSLSSSPESLPQGMNHTCTTMPPEAFSTCVNCHLNAGSGAFYPGDLHSSLANLKVSQPWACADCHSVSMPLGFVGPTATNPLRTPASGEMKHDAVVWAAGAPTTTAIVTADCSVCHAAPSQSQNASWATSTAGASPARYHSSLDAAGLAQPTSCVDCHANTRPTALVTSATGLAFDHATGEGTADCATCHTGPAHTWTSWKGGSFHAVGSASPTTCLPCHAGERPTTTASWKSTTYQTSPFDYGTNALNVTHGDGQDCAVCHKGAGAGGTWGVSQTWAGGRFDHALSGVAGHTCMACHLSQRPDATLKATINFDHTVDGTGDCFGCHQATVRGGTFVSYTIPGGDWKGGLAYPGSELVGSPSQFMTLSELNLIRSGNLVTGTTSVTSTVYIQMRHTSTAIPASIAPIAPSTNCSNCHGVGLSEGRFHSVLTSKGLPQPTGQCNDCHAPLLPVGIVQKTGADQQAMDHAAAFSAVSIGGATVTSVPALDCSSCHKDPGGSWSDGAFHATIGAAVPTDCLQCHYPLMADATKANVQSAADFKMAHGSAQLTSQACDQCHSTALSRATETPPASTSWSGGQLHARIATQPGKCNECHTVTQPTKATEGAVTYSLAQGGTATNQAQWMNHTSAQVVGKDCSTCHAADAKSSGGTWSKSTSFHANVPSVTSCQECHGLTNGGGSTPGTNNNMPAGLTNSSTVSSAASDPTTGVPVATRDQLSHGDYNVTSHDCSFCHTQVGPSTGGIAGSEWAQASLHIAFTAGQTLLTNGTTGRCSNCHFNLKPVATFAGYDHSALTTASGSQDCSACHAWPGTGTAAAPNWLGAAAAPSVIAVGGFTIPKPPAANTTTVEGGIASLPHPTIGTQTCTTCHTTASGGKGAIGYDHASTLASTNCNACHEAGSNLVGTVWSGATTQSSTSPVPAGDTRPFTLTSVVSFRGADRLTVTYANHFYPVDCAQCHKVPAGVGATTTGSAYLVPSTGSGAWTFPHTTSKMTNPSTCLMCHTNGIPP